MKEQTPNKQLPQAKLPEQIQLAGELFTLINSLRRNGNVIYRSADGAKIARYGKRQKIKRELNVHRKFESLGFPVAKLLQSREKSEPAYFIETSLGRECFSDIFRENNDDDTFNQFLLILDRFIQIQSKTKQKRVDWKGVRKSSRIDVLIEELPDRTKDIEHAWEKALDILSDQPFVITHGDLHTHNILPGGVIDLEDHFCAPAGYDLVSVLLAPTWFPNADDYEMRWPFTFTTRRNQQIIDTMQAASGYDLHAVFAPLLFLISCWWTVRMHKYPKLQAWRYQRFNQLLDKFLADQLILEEWMGMKD